MLSFPVRVLSQGAVQVDADLASDDPVWLEGDSRPVRGVHVTGRISGRDILISNERTSRDAKRFR